MTHDDETPISHVAEYQEWRKSMADACAASDDPGLAAVMFVNVSLDVALAHLGPQRVGLIMANAMAALRDQLEEQRAEDLRGKH